MGEISIEQLRQILPQTFPFLMIDKVIDYKENETLVAIKNITSGEWCFKDALSESSVFPETLLIEAAAQAAIVLYHISKNKVNERPLYFLGKVTANFLKPAVVGDQLRIEALGNKMLQTGGYSDIKVLVDGYEIANFEIIYKIHSRLAT